MKILALALAAAMLLPTLVHADEAADKAKAKDAIWAKEQAIWTGADPTVYSRNTAHDYKAWPPQAAQPGSGGGAPPDPSAPPSKQKITMTFVDFSYHGDTAIIYYATHRTMRADGTPADEIHETAHTWVLENGDWRVLGGMARRQPQR